MDIIPVKKYKNPKYPNKQKVLEDPKLLNTLPERWKDNLYVSTALSTLLLITLSACTPKQTSDSSPKNNKYSIAPIFEHGNGRGSFGCSSVAPPSFLSEEEAFQVIQEEGEKYNISFEKDGLELKNIRLPETKYYLKPEESNSSFKQNGGSINSTRKGDLFLDGYDAQKKIGYEFISTDDYEEWQVKQNTRSTVDDYDFLSTAKLLKEGISKKNDEVSVGIFYNPMTSLSPEQLHNQTDFKILEDKLKNLAKEDLRKQVKDFLQWLKAQEII